jgi:hypothetical protein
MKLFSKFYPSYPPWMRRTAAVIWAYIAFMVVYLIVRKGP